MVLVVEIEFSDRLWLLPSPGQAEQKYTMRMNCWFGGISYTSPSLILVLLRGLVKLDSINIVKSCSDTIHIVKIMFNQYAHS